MVLWLAHVSPESDASWNTDYIHTLNERWKTDALSVYVYSPYKLAAAPSYHELLKLVLKASVLLLRAQSRNSWLQSLESGEMSWHSGS